MKCYTLRYRVGNQQKSFIYRDVMRYEDVLASIPDDEDTGEIRPVKSRVSEVESQNL